MFGCRLHSIVYYFVYDLRSVYVGDQMRESGAHVDAMTNLKML